MLLHSTSFTACCTQLVLPAYNNKQTCKEAISCGSYSFEIITNYNIIYCMHGSNTCTADEDPCSMHAIWLNVVSTYHTSSPDTGPLDAIKLTLTIGMKALGEGPGLSRRGKWRITVILPLYMSTMPVDNSRKPRISFARTSILERISIVCWKI